VRREFNDGWTPKNTDFEQKKTKGTKALGRRPNATGETPVPPGTKAAQLGALLFGRKVQIKQISLHLNSDCAKMAA